MKHFRILLADTFIAFAQFFYHRPMIIGSVYINANTGTVQIGGNIKELYEKDMAKSRKTR